MEPLRFAENMIEIIIVALYPTLELYIYFVFIGIFCLESHPFDSWGIFVIFIVFHCILMLKLVVFMQIFVTEGRSTLEIFPHMVSSDKCHKFNNVNPYVLDTISDAKTIGNISICNICKTYKPPRAHHCSRCNRCYLKYDHHCYFLDVCIGYHNYKFFLQFIFLNQISILLFLVIIGIDLLVVDNSIFSKINYGVALVLYAIEFLLNGFLIVFNIQLLNNNETTIEKKAIDEYIKGDHSYVSVFAEGPISEFSDSRDRKVLNPYNLGLKSNWLEIFGPKIIDWFKPNFSSIGNGVTFKTNTNS